MYLVIMLAAAPLSGADPGMEGMREVLASYRRNLVEAVEKTHEGYLDFRPTAEVNSFREMVGHIVDAQYAVCSTAKQEKNPQAERITKKVLSKAELVRSLEASFGYCDDVLASLDAAKLAQKVKTGQAERAVSYHAAHAVEHTALHYGNLVTYMRLRGMVPPETERRNLPAAALPKPEMVTYYMGFLKKGAKWTAEATPEIAKIQEGHMAHMKKSHEAGKLVLAGPFADNSEIRGILIYKTANLEEARGIAEQDPAVLAGRLQVEMHPWMVQKGYLP